MARLAFIVSVILVARASARQYRCVQNCSGRWPMSLMGHERLSGALTTTSAFPFRADPDGSSAKGRFVPIPDSCTAANSSSIRSPHRGEPPLAAPRCRALAQYEG
jgi:hypothetical protein